MTLRDARQLLTAHKAVDAFRGDHRPTAVLRRWRHALRAVCRRRDVP
jgi:hypothetical protein